MHNIARKALMLILTGILAISCVSALGMETKLTGVRMQPDFWGGVFPTIVSYMYQVSGLEFIPERSTELGVEMETGTLARELSRDPETGETLAEEQMNWVEAGQVEEDAKYIWTHPYYDTMYAGMNLKLSQGFFKSWDGNDLFTLSAGLKGRWEIALNPLLDYGKRVGSPFTEYAPFKDGTLYLPGTPDLSGNRQLFHIAFFFGGKIKDLRRKTARIEGADLEFEFMYAPHFTNTSYNVGGRAEFMKFLLNTSESVMLFTKTDDKGNNVWSLGLSNSLAFRFLTGKDIPYYAEAVNLPLGWYEPENTTFLVEDIIRIDYYGRQFFRYFAPHIYVFVDLSYNWGKLNNSTVEKQLAIFTASAGVHIELMIGDHMALYYEIGNIFAYTGPNSDYYKGFVGSDSVKISLSVEF